MGINGLSRLRWLGVMAPEARNPAEAGPPFLTILLASCGSAAPVASGARRPERSRWRCGAPVGHGRLRLPQIIADWPCSFASRAFAVAGYRPRLRPTNDAGREVRRCHGGGPTRGDTVTDFPLIKAAKLWARVSARTGPGPCTRATTSAPRRSSQETEQHHGSGHAGQNGRGQQPERRILEMQDGLRLHGASSCSCDARPCPVGGVSASPALRYARTARWSSRDLLSDRRPTGSRLRRPKTTMCDPDQLAVSDGGESDAAPGKPDDEPEPYRPVLTDEEREVLRREWLAALCPSLLAGIERPDRGGSRRAEPSRPIRR